MTEERVDKKVTPQENTGLSEPQPDLITVPDTPAPKGDKSSKPAPEDEKPKGSPAAEKPKAKSDAKDPRQQLIDELMQMVEEINADVTKAFKSGMSKLGDKFSKTESGESLGKLKDELDGAKDGLNKAAIDGENENLDALKSSEKLKPIADVLSSAKQKVADIDERINRDMVSLVDKADDKVSKIGMDSPKSSATSPTQAASSDVKDVPGPKSEQSKEVEQQPVLDNAEAPSTPGNTN